MYAEIVVDRPIVKNRPAPFDNNAPDSVDNLDENPLAVTFHYAIPDPLAGQVKPGHMVAVPFRWQQLPGVVVNLSPASPVENVRSIEAILDARPMLTAAQIALARWLSETYLAPLIICLKLFLPPGASRKLEMVLRPTKKTFQQQLPLSAQEQILLTFLRKQQQIPLGEADRAAAEGLIDKGLAEKAAILGQTHVGPKLDRQVELLIPPDEVETVLPTLGRRSKAADMLRHLANSDDPLPALADVLAITGATRQHAYQLAEQQWVELTPGSTTVMLPPAARDKAISALDLSDAAGDPAPLNELIRSEPGHRVLRHLSRYELPVPLDAVLEAADATMSTINTLQDKGLVVRFDEPERITLKLPSDEVTPAVVELRQAQKPAAVLRLLAAEDGPVWIGWVYAQTDANLQTLRDLAEVGYIGMDEQRRWRDPLAGRMFTLDQPPTLSPDQEGVWQTLVDFWQLGEAPEKPVLLHGVTGSGKTEIYLQAIAAALRNNRGAVMLVPEIALATQSVERVAARFPEQVAVWHSNLSPGERFDTWERIRSGELPIVVGPRSALFAPINDLGVIIVDEEHEPAYKQHDRTPMFHTREAAIKLGQLSNALVLLGSATPDVETYRKAERGEYLLLSLPNRILAHTQHVAVQQAMLKRAVSLMRNDQLVTLPLPRTEVIDMREELKANNRTIFSRTLQQAIYDTLRRGEQVILFLNRRGASSFVICRDCGYVMECPRCDTTLTYHSEGEAMLCHFCGYRGGLFQRCPTCDSTKIRYFGLGTQRVEETVRKMYPEAKPIRWDVDTARQKNSHSVFLEHFIKGRANVMIGTQMVAKGLDLPLVTLVGVISADTSLYLPDFRAAERTFQLLMQVAGRAGRSPLGGQVIIQTYNPDVEVIQAASHHDYMRFYQAELEFRREQRYPPFKRVALMLYSGPGAERSAYDAQMMTDRLKSFVARAGLPAVDIIGPTPSHVRRIRDQYRWQILLRAPDPAAVLRPLMPLPQGWRVNIDPVTLM